MSTVAARSLQEIIDRDAPIDASRATTVMLAVTRGLLVSPARSGDATAALLRASEISIDAGANVTILGRRCTPGHPSTDEPSEDVRYHADGAATGRLLFALLVGREPIDRTDARMPLITDSLSAPLWSLLDRSVSEVPAHWPSVDEWHAELERSAGRLAMDPSVSERHGRQRRRRLIGVAVAVIVALSAATVAFAPSWWNSVNSSAPAPTATAHHALRASS